MPVSVLQHENDVNFPAGGPWPRGGGGGGRGGGGGGGRKAANDSCKDANGSHHLRSYSSLFFSPVSCGADGGRGGGGWRGRNDVIFPARLWVWLLSAAAAAVVTAVVAMLTSAGAQSGK